MTKAPAINKARAFWLKQLHTWHWISAGLSLAGMILFAVTGITLNHAAQIPAEPVTVEQTATLEAALSRRLDRLSRQADRLEHHVQISNEALALFVRFWLTTTPPLPDTAQPAAQASGRERYHSFVEALGRRMETGRTLAHELSQDTVFKSPDGEEDSSR